MPSAGAVRIGAFRGHLPSDAEVGFRGRCQSKTGARPAARAPIRLSARGRVGVSPQLNGAPSRVRSSPRRPQMRSRSLTGWLRRRLHAGSAAPGEYWVYCGPCSTPRARYAARTPRDRRGGSVSGDPSAKQQPASESGASLHSRPGGGAGRGRGPSASARPCACPFVPPPSATPFSPQAPPFSHAAAPDEAEDDDDGGDTSSRTTCSPGHS